MKRLLMIIILLFSVSVSTYGTEAAQYDNAGALHQAWMAGEGLPDYISGVWSTDGGSDNLTFGIVREEKLQAEGLYEIIRDKESLTVVYQTYSYNTLRSVQQALEHYLNDGLGFVSIGVDVYKNCVELEVHEDHREDHETQAVLRSIEEVYGDRVQLSYTDLYVQPVGRPADGYLWMLGYARGVDVVFWIVSAALLLAVANGIVLWRQRCRVLFLGKGQTTAAAHRDKPSVRDVKEMVRAGLPAFPDSVDRRLQESIAAQN